MWYLPIRLLIGAMIFCGTIVNFVLRVNINLSVLAMSPPNCTTSNQSLSNGMNPQETSGFCWTEREKGMLKAAFFYGYVFLQVPGGRLSEIWGTRLVLGVSTLIGCLITLLGPWLAHWNVWALIVSRVILGLFQGVLYPCMYPILVHWSPTNELATLTAFASMGGTFGIIFIYPILGEILSAYGWEAVFYGPGCLGLVWCVAWFGLVNNDPTEHRLVSNYERDMILAQRPVEGDKPPKLRYLPMLRSIPMWVVILCFLASDVNSHILTTEGPNFLVQVFGMDITTVGWVSSVPFIGRYIMSQLSSILSDFLITKPQWISKLNVRRMCFILCLGSVGFSLGFLALNVHTWSIYLLITTIGYTLSGFCMPAWINIMEIAPNYPGTVSGLINGISSLAGFVVPMMTVVLTEHDPTDPVGWQMLFVVGSLVNVLGAMLFCWKGSVTPQPFNFRPVDSISGSQTKDPNISI